MKKIILLLFTILPVIGMSQIKFSDLSFEQAKELANKEEMMIFVDLSATWCGPCKTMKTQVFQDKEIGEYFNNNFISLFIECDIDKNSAELMKQLYNFSAFPTLLFLDKDGVLVHKIVGSMDKKEFLDNVKKAVGGENYVSYLARYNSGENSPEFIRELIKVVDNAYDLELSTKLTNTYLNSLSISDLVSKENWNLLINNIDDIDSETAQKFLQNREKFVAAYSEADVDAYINVLWTRKAYSFANRETKKFDKDGYDTFIKRLDASKFKGAKNIKWMSSISNCEISDNWSEYIELVEEKIKEGISIDRFYELAASLDRGCKDNKLRERFTKITQKEFDRAVRNNEFAKYEEFKVKYGDVYNYEKNIAIILERLKN